MRTAICVSIRSIWTRRSGRWWPRTGKSSSTSLPGCGETRWCCPQRTLARPTRTPAAATVVPPSHRLQRKGKRRMMRKREGKTKRNP